VPTFEEVEALLKAGKFDDAILATDAILKQNPQSAWALAIRAYSLMYLGKAQAALSDFDTAIALDPKKEPLHYGRCLVLYQLDRLDDAVAACSTAVDLDPNDTAALDQLALTHDAKNDAANERLGLDEISRSIELDPSSAWALAERCELKIELKM
jgi:tetratricopeptide (TPR) repeat protein